METLRTGWLRQQDYGLDSLDLILDSGGMEIFLHANMSCTGAASPTVLLILLKYILLMAF